MTGFVLRRLREHALVIAACLATVVLTTGVLAGISGFTSAVGDAGVRRLLTGADAASTTLDLTATAPQGRDSADRSVAAVADQAFAGFPHRTASLALSDSYALPAAGTQTPARAKAKAAAPAADTAVLGDVTAGHARLLSGRWPRAGAGDGQASAPEASEAPEVLEVAVPSAAESRIGGPGTTLTVRDTGDGHALRLLVVGVYQALPGDTFWQLDAYGGHGEQRIAGTTTTGYGPLAVAPTALGGTAPDAASTTAPAPADAALPLASVSYQVVPDLSGVTVARLGPLADAVTAATAQAQGAGLESSTQLPPVVAQAQGDDTTARSTLLVVIAQLVLLAMVALLLTARLLAEQREAQHALLRARGAAPARLVLLAAAEALLLTLPALVVAPPLARVLVGVLSDHGPLAASGVRLHTTLFGPVAWTALAGALGSAVVLVLPVLARARGWRTERQRATRHPALPSVLRGGADLALLALAAVGYWQLRHYAPGSAVGAAAGQPGTARGVDPVLVLAPTLAVAAGAVLLLRLVPLVGRVGELVASRLRGLPGALVAWQLARRPQRGAGPVLALALAVTLGLLAVGQSGSWDRSQRDQAAFDTGGDVRVAGSSMPAFGQGGAYAAVPGVARAVPVGRAALALDSGGTAELLALDTRAEADVLPLRHDLADRSAAALLGGLAAAPLTSAQRGIPLPGRPRSVELEFTAGTAQPLARDEQWDNGGDDAIGLFVTDRFGTTYQLGTALLPIDGRTHRFSFDLTGPAGGGTPGYPLTLSRIDLDAPLVSTASDQDANAPAPTQELRLAQVLTTGQDGSTATATAAPPAGFAWHGVAEDSDPDGNPYGGDDGTASASASASGTGQGALLRVTADPTAPLTAEIRSAVHPSNGYYGDTLLTFGPVRPALSTVLPAVVDRRFLAATGARVGSVVPLPAGPAGIRIRITGVVSALPGTGAAAEQGLSGAGAPSTASPYGGTDASGYGGAVLVDLARYDRLTEQLVTQQGQVEALPVEWWLTLDHPEGAPAPAATADRAAAALRALPGGAAVYARSQVVTALEHDPLGTGPQTALLAAAALAALLAAVGFGVDAVGSVAARRGETAVLAGLGLRRRGLLWATAGGLAVPALLGTGFGLLLGEAVTRLLVPLLVLTPQGQRPVPSVLVDLPLGTVLPLAAAIAAVPLATAVLVGLRGGDPKRLRQQEEEN